MNNVIKLKKKVRVTTKIPTTYYVFTKEQLNYFIETNRIATIFSWLFSLALEIAIGAWFSLKQTGIDVHTSYALQMVQWSSLILSLLLGSVAAWFAWKHRKIQNELTSQ